MLDESAELRDQQQQRTTALHYPVRKQPFVSSTDNTAVMIYRCHCAQVNTITNKFISPPLKFHMVKLHDGGVSSSGRARSGYYSSSFTVNVETLEAPPLHTKAIPITSKIPYESWLIVSYEGGETVLRAGLGSNLVLPPSSRGYCIFTYSAHIFLSPMHRQFPADSPPRILCLYILYCVLPLQIVVAPTNLSPCTGRTSAQSSSCPKRMYSPTSHLSPASFTPRLPLASVVIPACHTLSCPVLSCFPRLPERLLDPIPR